MNKLTSCKKEEEEEEMMLQQAMSGELSGPRRYHHGYYGDDVYEWGIIWTTQVSSWLLW